MFSESSTGIEDAYPRVLGVWIGGEIAERDNSYNRELKKSIFGKFWDDRNEIILSIKILSIHIFWFRRCLVACWLL